MNPGGTMRIPNVAVWLLFDQVHILREKYVATASRCDNVFSNVFVTYGYGLDVNVKTLLRYISEYAIYLTT